MELPNNTCPLCGSDDISLDDVDNYTDSNYYHCEYCRSTWRVDYITRIKDYEVLSDETGKAAVVNHEAQLQINFNIRAQE